MNMKPYHTRAVATRRAGGSCSIPDLGSDTMQSRQPFRGSETPWGPVQTVEPVVPGVVNISTAGHGGYWCSPARWEELLRLFPDINPWAGPGWLEEDCDWAFAALTWPEVVEGQTLYHAIASVQRVGGSDSGVADAFLATPQGKVLIAAAAAWRESVAHLWEMGSRGTVAHAGGSWTCFRRVGDGAERTVLGFDRGYKTLYTTEELDAADAMYLVRAGAPVARA